MDGAGDLESAMRAVPGGAWAVGVSGGADSVALLMLLRRYRPEVDVHVVHLDHQTRDGESAADARFVAELAERLGLGVTVRRRSEIEAGRAVLANRSARFRAARLALFAEVVERHQLRGVLLGHHADDQAETVLLRLLRGAGPSALAGMKRESRVGGLWIVRPLLGVAGARLREALAAGGQGWREDASNALPGQLRNRLRMMLRQRPEVRERLIELGSACGAIGRWTAAAAPVLGERFGVEMLAGATPVARHAAARWLAARGVPPDRADRAAADRLIQLASDAGSAARQTFAGGVVVRRRRGIIFAEKAGSPPGGGQSPAASHRRPGLD